MSTAGISAAVTQAVDDVIGEMNGSGQWPVDIDSEQTRVMVGAIVRAVLERLEAQATAGADPVQINE